jgi:hypothetical protein
MNIRFFFTALILAALAALWWYMNDCVSIRYVGMIEQNGDLKAQAKGWDLVTHLFPLLLTCGIFFGAMVSFVLSFFGEIAAEADLRVEIRELKERVKESEKNAQSAREELVLANEKAYAFSERNAEKVIAQHREKETAAKSAEREAVKVAQNAEKQRDQMAYCLLELESKLGKCQGFSIRFKRKIAKVSKELDDFLFERGIGGNEKAAQILAPLTKINEKPIEPPRKEQSPCLELARSLKRH